MRVPHVREKASRDEGLVGFVRSILKTLSGALTSRYSLDEIINILRPVIYVWAILRYGKNSWKAIKLSFGLDLI